MEKGNNDENEQYEDDGEDNEEYEDNENDEEEIKNPNPTKKKKME